MKQYIEQLLKEAITTLRQQQQWSITTDFPIQVQRARERQHGDYASNVALMLAKQLKQAPREIATALIAHINTDSKLAKVDIAGPGFINFYVRDELKQTIINDILSAQDNFGRCDIADSKKLHIEFVSANPTGPMHVGHGRHAAYGMSVVNLLRMIGYQVHAEYYINDAGRQMDILAASVWLRYLQQFDATIPFPTNAYHGDYVIDIAKTLVAQQQRRFYYSPEEIFTGLPNDDKDNGDTYIDALIAQAKKLLAKDYAEVHQFGLQIILDDIRQDLEEFGVEFDGWFSERTLVENGKVEQTLQQLQAKDLLYRQDGALWFKSSQFGDEKDRVFQRENGQNTYFASDIAYHLDKLERGFERVIDVLGADHHGYVPRVRAAMRALGANDQQLDTPIVQFAVLFRGKQKVQMSTRSGEFVTLRELRQEVGNDATRFFYVMRKVSQHIDFDLELAKSHSNENPVYYVQYAHARICSVFKQYKQNQNRPFERKIDSTTLALLTRESELALIDHLNDYQDTLIQAAQRLEPCLLSNYLRELAAYFHSYYNTEQFLVDDAPLQQARLNLITAVKQVIANGLSLLGVSAPEEM
ncbi:MAG: arginine--tRNA ligase [Pseudomonadota bacterium]